MATAIKREKSEPAYCQISCTSGLYLVHYYNHDNAVRCTSEGYDITVFRDIPDDIPLIDFSECENSNLIIDFIMANDQPNTIDYSDNDESIDSYLKRYADFIGITVQTVGEYRRKNIKT